jgi:hypothetical protein
LPQTAPKMYQNLGFENEPSGNPGLGSSITRAIGFQWC